MNAVISQPDNGPYARILDVSDDEYFADPCEVPSLSQSAAHTLLTGSPLHCWNDHPRLGNNRDGSTTKALDAGQLVHKLLLGKGQQLAIIDADDFRTKTAQQLRDLAYDANQLPVLRRIYDETVKVADVLRTNIELFGIKLNGESEIAMEWDEQGEHGPVRCRGKMDHIVFDRGTIYDIKKIRSAHPDTCSKHLYEYGYDIQHAAYCSALAKLTPEFTGKVDFVFLFMELEAPYCVLPVRPDGQLRELGSMRWSRAVHVWERCLRNNKWPGYSDSIVTLSAPKWALDREMMSGEW